MKTAPLLSKPRGKSNGVISRTVLAACRFIPTSVFDWKVQRFYRLKGTSLECMEIYVKTTETACVSDELCCDKL